MKISRRSFLSSVCATAMLLASQAEARAPHGVSVTGFQQVLLGGGGFVTGIDIAPDGTRIARTDTAGAFVRLPGSSTWNQLLTQARMPVADSDSSGKFGGVYSVAVSYSNSARMYMLGPLGYVYRSDDRGNSWARTATNPTGAPISVLPNDQANGGDNARIVSPYMRVDPNNQDVVICGTPSNGTYLSTDAGATWAQISTVGTSQSDGSTGWGHLVQFDTSGGTITVSGQTRAKNCFLSTYNTTSGGVWKSTDGLQSWTKLNTTGMPTTHHNMFCDTAGVLWFCDHASSHLLQYKAGAWTDISATKSFTDSVQTVIVDHSNANNVFAINFTGKQFNSNDGGVTWSPENDFTIASSRIGWPSNAELSPSPNHSIGIQSSAWDQSLGRAVCGSGIGTFSCPFVPGTGTITWTPDSLGLENLDATSVCSVPNGGPMLFTTQDRPFWVISDPTVYPSNYGPNYTDDIAYGHHGCFAISDSTVLWANHHGLVGSDSGGAFVSTNSGAGWTKTSTQPAGFGTIIGGSMAAYSSSNAVWAVANDGGPFYTLNGGLNWNACTTGAADLLGWGHAYFYSTIRVAADGLDANTYYLYNDGNQNTHSADVGVYKSTDGGQNFSKVSGTQLNNAVASTVITFFFAQLKSVYGKSGHLFFTPGADPNGTLPNGQSFLRSTDHGATWTALPNVQSVLAFGFGASSGGSGYLSLFIAGWVSGVPGIWVSHDADQATPTWTKIANLYPSQYDVITCASGDYNNAGRCYVGYLGSGFLRYG